MSEVISDVRKKNISTHPPVIFVWTDQMYCKYKLCLVYLCSALRAVRHTRLALRVFLCSTGIFQLAEISENKKYKK